MKNGLSRFIKGFSLIGCENVIVIENYCAMFIGMNNKELSFKVVFWVLWTALTAVFVCYIIHNAQWLIGDDAILIRHTG